MHKVLTITANTAIDRIIEVKGFQIGKPVRAARSSVYPAGKGVNVARSLKTLGSEVDILGFVGTSDLALFESMNSSSSTVRLIPVPGLTRTNITIFDSLQQTTTHVIDSGFGIDPNVSAVLSASVRDHASAGDVVIISGSLPLGAPADLYKNLIEECHQKQAIVIFDSSNDELRYGLQAKPFMVKPNVHELETLAERELGTSERDIVDAALAVMLQGIPLVVVSRGVDGIILVSKELQGVWKARIVLEELPEAIGGVGCGDALVAGFAKGIATEASMDEMMKLGVACGAANLLMEGPGTFRLLDVQRFLPRVEINRLR